MPETNNIPIISVSASIDLMNSNANNIFDGLIGKPFNINVIE